MPTTYEGQPVHDGETQTVTAEMTKTYRAPETGGASAPPPPAATTGHAISG